jgi:hypothetical protein
LSLSGARGFAPERRLPHSDTFRPAGTRRVAAVAFLLLLLMGGGRNASGQSNQQTEFDWFTEAVAFGANALLGGASTGLAALVRGDPLVPAFARGAGGGSLVYAGKRIAVDSRSGMGLLGRQVASVGGSIIGNEVGGRRSFDRIAFGAGPVRAYVGRDVAGVDWRVPAMAFTACTTRIQTTSFPAGVTQT